MFNKILLSSAALTLMLGACTSQGLQDLRTVVSTDISVMETVGSDVISINKNIINDTKKLSNAFLTVNCPFVNSYVNLKQKMLDDPLVASRVKNIITGTSGVALKVNDICISAGFTPSQ